LRKSTRSFRSLGKNSTTETDACSSIGESMRSTGSASPRNKSEKMVKKKSRRRAFGDEVQVARDKRERNIDKAIVKEVAKQSKSIARDQVKTVAEKKAAGTADNGMAGTGKAPAGMDKRASRRSLKKEAQKAIEQELIEKGLEARRRERRKERERSGFMSISFKKSKSMSRMHATHGGRHAIDEWRSNSCGRGLKAQEEEDESISDIESLWRGGRFKINDTDDCPPPQALVRPVADRKAGMEAPVSSGNLKADSAAVAGPALFPRSICNTLVKLDSMLSTAGSSILGTTPVRGFAGLTTEVLEEAGSSSLGHNSSASFASDGDGFDFEPSRSDSAALRNRPLNPSARSRAMEQEIARMKTEIVKTSAEERELRHEFERLRCEKLRLEEENTAGQNRIRDSNRTKRFLNDELNRMRKHNAELVPLIKGLKINVWRAKRDRDELRKLSYEMAQEAGKSDRIMKWRDWLSDDLMKEELGAGEDNRAILGLFSRRGSLFA